MSRDYLHDEAIVQKFSVTSDSLESLRASVRIAFSGHKSVTHFKKTKNSMSFFWAVSSNNSDEATPLPYELNKDNAFDFIYAWLKSVEENDRLIQYPDMSDGDGSDGFGFKIKSEESYCSFTITAMNLYYSK